MRDKKFRMWLNGKFSYWGFIRDHGCLVFAGLSHSNVEFLSMEQMMERSQEFTGLHDKNGKEIWENDWFKNERANPFLIIWEDGGFKGKHSIEKINIPYGFRFDQYEAKTGEILGNIHENSELLDCSHNGPTVTHSNGDIQCISCKEIIGKRREFYD